MDTPQNKPEATEFPPPARLMSISVHAGEVFANQEKAIHWLRSPNPSLDGKTPLEAAQLMRVYRLCRGSYPPYDGEGAKRAGARRDKFHGDWNYEIQPRKLSA